jgi:hypothetical protein
MLRYTYTACLIVTEKDCVLCEVRDDAEESQASSMTDDVQ